MNEATLNEAETRVELIDPGLKAAGWGVMETAGAVAWFPEQLTGYEVSDKLSP